MESDRIYKKWKKSLEHVRCSCFIIVIFVKLFKDYRQFFFSNELQEVNIDLFMCYVLLWIT